MIWQDWVIGIVQVLFLLALIPSVRGKDKPAKWTSFMTGTCMWVLSLVYATLLMFFSALVAFALGYMWFALAAQVYNRDRMV